MLEKVVKSRIGDCLRRREKVADDTEIGFAGHLDIGFPVDCEHRAGSLCDIWGRVEGEKAGCPRVGVGPELGYGLLHICIDAFLWSAFKRSQRRTT